MAYFPEIILEYSICHELQLYYKKRAVVSVSPFVFYISLL